MTLARRLFVHNIGWKLGSLGLAILLWFAVIGEEQLVTAEAVQVYYQNLPPDLVVVSDPPLDVELELQGPSAVLGRESLAGVKILLDLSRVQAPGEQTFTIEADDVTLPEGVGFLSAKPSRLFLEFDRRGMKEVPVEVEISGTPADGYEVIETSTRPAKIAVRGPEMRLRELNAVQTDAVDVSELTKTVQVPVSVYAFDPKLQLESGEPVIATVTIAKESLEKLSEKGPLPPHE